MLRSMFAGVSGLKSHQQMMDVIGDNIANVNTAGFKASRVVFQDTLSQLVRDGSAAGAANGSVDPQQIGLGVKVNAVDTVNTQGALQSTGRPTDMAIQGSGFFAMQLGDGTTGYSRSGSFTMDANNNLTDPSGALLLGYNTDPATGTTTPDPTQTPVPAPALLTIPATYDDSGTTRQLSSFSIAGDGTVSAVYDGVTKTVGQVGLTHFDNPAGLLKAGDGHLKQGSASGAPVSSIPGSAGVGTLATGALEMSNVDLAQEFTNMMIAQRGFQANSKVISTSDELLQVLVDLKR